MVLLPADQIPNSHLQHLTAAARAQASIECIEGACGPQCYKGSSVMNSGMLSVKHMQGIFRWVLEHSSPS